VVLPAILSTAAAIFAALPARTSFAIFYLSPASAFAGTAAVLMAVHKALKCDEYQAECLRLSQAYGSIAISAESALLGPDGEHDALQKRLTDKLEALAESTKAQLPTRSIRQAEKMTGAKLSGPSTELVGVRVR